MNYHAKFYQGCKQGDLEKVKLAVAQNIDTTNMIDVCFIEACSGGYTNIIHYLISLDKDKLNLNEGLEKACIHQQYEAIDMLIRNGANIKHDNYSAFKVLIDNLDEKNLDFFVQPLLQNIFEELKSDLITDRHLKLDMIKWAINSSQRKILDQIINKPSHTLLQPEEISNILKESIKINPEKILSDWKNGIFNKELENLLPTAISEIFNAVLESNDVISYQFFHKKLPSFSSEYKMMQAIDKKSWDIAYEILKTSSFKDAPLIDYESEKNTGIYNSDGFFIKEAILPRYYTPLKLETNKERFTYILLSKAYYVYPMSYKDVINDIIKNRKNLEFKDEYILQFLMEAKYDLPDEYDDRNISIKDILETVIEENLDLKIDKQGYLIQQAIGYCPECIIEKLIEKGSSLEGFLKRYENKNNWLNKKDFNRLEEEDRNGDRKYDIYKKFDEMHHLNEKTITYIKNLNMKNKLQCHLPLKDNEHNKIKI